MRLKMFPPNISNVTWQFIHTIRSYVGPTGTAIGLLVIIIVKPIQDKSKVKSKHVFIPFYTTFG